MQITINVTIIPNEIKELFNGNIDFFKKTIINTLNADENEIMPDVPVVSSDEDEAVNQKIQITRQSNPWSKPEEKQEIFTKLNSMLQNREDIYVKSFYKEFASNISYTCLVKWINEWMGQSLIAPSYKKTVAQFGRGTKRPIIYKHTGIIRLSNDSQPGLKAIPARGGKWKQQFAPKIEELQEETI